MNCIECGNKKTKYDRNLPCHKCYIKRRNIELDSVGGRVCKKCANCHAIRTEMRR